MKMLKNKIKYILLFTLIFLIGCMSSIFADSILSDVGEYTGNPYVEINNNIPFFTEEELTTNSYENYGALDSLGRCTACTASIGLDLMPTEERGPIGSVKPTGWENKKYDNVDGKYLYNRCHLIGYQLTGENANERNLITGTRYLNIEGMLDFENKVANYVNITGNHVLYRVTPIFNGDNLVASGVLMEGYSVEDRGKGICYNVFCYNVQPGIGIDYATGNSWEDPNTINLGSGLIGSQSGENNTSDLKKENEENGGLAWLFGGDSTTNKENEVSNVINEENTYILNTNSKKFHKPSCKDIGRISESNRSEITTTRDALIKEGYTPCGHCDP